MPTARFSNLDDERKQRILGVAAGEFAEKGYAKASYNAIIRDSGLSKGVMYYYFEDKADLCRTVVRHALGPLLDAAAERRQAADAGEFWEQLHASAAQASVMAVRSPEAAALGRLIYGEGSSPEVLGPLIDDAEAWCAELLAEGRSVGAIRDDLPLSFLATAIIGMLVHADRWFAVHIDALEPAELERISRVCLEMIEKLASPSAPRTSP